MANKFKIRREGERRREKEEKEEEEEEEREREREERGINGGGRFSGVLLRVCIA